MTLKTLPVIANTMSTAANTAGTRPYAASMEVVDADANAGHVKACAASRVPDIDGLMDAADQGETGRDADDVGDQRESSSFSPGDLGFPRRPVFSAVHQPTGCSVSLLNKRSLSLSLSLSLGAFLFYLAVSKLRVLLCPTRPRAHGLILFDLRRVWILGFSPAGGERRQKDLV